MTYSAGQFPLLELFSRLDESQSKSHAEREIRQKNRKLKSVEELRFVPMSCGGPWSGQSLGVSRSVRVQFVVHGRWDDRECDPSGRIPASVLYGEFGVGAGPALRG